MKIAKRDSGHRGPHRRSFGSVCPANADGHGHQDRPDQRHADRSTDARVAPSARVMALRPKNSRCRMVRC